MAYKLISTMKIKIIHSIIRTAAILSSALALIIAAGCENDFDMDLPLAVSADHLSLNSAAGSTHVLVYSTGKWTARFSKNVNWASLDKVEGYGNNEVILTYAENFGISRNLYLIFEKGELADTIVFSQEGTISEPTLSFRNAAITLTQAAASVAAGISTNLKYAASDMGLYEVFYDSEGNPSDTVSVISPDGQSDTLTSERWISNVSITSRRVNFDVTKNDTGSPRIADLVLYIKNAEGDETHAILSITQITGNPEFKLESNEGTYDGIAQECVVSTLSNNIIAYLDKITFNVTYSPAVATEEDEWVHNVTLTSNGLEFNIDQNLIGSARSATISIQYTDSEGNSVNDTYTISQNAYPSEMTFSDVRELSAGTIDQSCYIDGYVVSDPESKNIISSPQTDRWKFDRTLNDRTVYIESKDGSYGFCLQFATSSDNKLERYSLVRLSLKGAELVKESDPDRYTLKGLTEANIMEASDPDAFKIPVKTKTISELTDDDIFTLVSIPDMEIMCKDGCYTNCTDGYSLKDANNPVGASSPRWDVAPLLCYDKSGGSIFMLTNAATPWRRFSSGHDLEFNTVVPQGSGTFKGIVVADDMAPIRYGDLGRYQLRAMTEEDIDLNSDPFSNTIVEWNWNDLKTDVTPEIGDGTIDYYSASMASCADFNNVVSSGKGGSTGEMKGLVSTGGINLTQLWWDFANDTGKYFDISFSTKGISGSEMIFGIVWGHGSMGSTSITGPDHWKLLYSVDGGATFSDVPDCPIIKSRAIVWWTNTPQDVTPGFTEHFRILPDECFGKDKVVLRLQVADKVTDKDPKATSSNYKTALCVEKGILTSSISAGNCQARIGTITVRYF